MFNNIPISRRESLKLAAAGVGGISFSQWLPTLAVHAANNEKTKHKSCILLWMDGGPSQHDTFDPKSESPSEYRGMFRSIATSVPGLHISEGYGRLSRLMNHAAVIRSMKTTEGAEHLRGRVYMHTGYRPNFGGLDYPSIGSLVSYHRTQNTGLPNYVVTGTTMQGFPHVSNSAFLGPKHNGTILQNPRAGLSNTSSYVDFNTFNDRISLADALAKQFQRTSPVSAVKSHDAAYASALELMRSNKAKAFDLSLEPTQIHDRYGKHEFGQGCLLARRLIEAGVPFVEVYLSDWDSHEKRRADLVKDTLLPVSDQAITALLTDLIDRGMLDDTLVIWMGEFGRTPQCGADGSRQHYDKAWSTVLFGGGVKGGQIIGKTDDKGIDVIDRPVSGPDFMATILDLLGIDPTIDLYVGARPVRITDPSGSIIKELERT